jgi:hypothetical protein
MKIRKLSKLSIALLLLVSILSIALAATVYFRTYDSHWGVNVAYGLVLYEGSSSVSSIEWGLIPQYGSLSKNFTLVNTGNLAANTTIQMPSGPSFYFSTTFIPYTIILPYNGNYTFSITLHDTDMIAETSYSGNFTFAIIG